MNKSMSKDCFSDSDDDFDISSLLGMNNLVNRNEVDLQTNAKVVERELLAGFNPSTSDASGGDSGGDDSTHMHESGMDSDDDTVDPVDEYNAMMESIMAGNSASISISMDSPHNHPPNSMDISSHGESFLDESTNDQVSDTMAGHSSASYSDAGSKAGSMYDPWQAYTEEHSNQMIADQILPPVNDSRYDMADENTSDMKLTLLEKIDNLREELEDDGVPIDKIPRVDFNSQLSEVEYVAKLLMLKANRNRYSNMGEEFILAFSSILETLFNGKRKFFGVAPNLTNCSDIVKVKLRRVKNETSQIVSNVVEKYEISPLTTVMIELLPSIFLHSRRRSLQSAPVWGGDDASTMRGGAVYDLSDDINEIRKY
jgi:hypothetical protein